MGASACTTSRLYAPATTQMPWKPLRSQDFHSWIDRNCGNRGLTGTVCARLPAVKRTASTLLAIWALMLAAAPAALAEGGVGLAGPADDKVITFFCFGVIIFFAVLVIGMSLIQGKLEKRKERRRTDLERLS